MRGAVVRRRARAGAGARARQTRRKTMRSVKMTICLGLVAGLAIAAVPSARAQEAAVEAQTLGDVLREYGWDQVIGTWVDEETKGEGLKLTYGWRFEDHVVELTSRSPQEETVAIMGRNAQNGDIYHFGATSRGGSSLGKWEVVDGDAVLGLMFTGGDGQQGGMRIRHHLESDDVMLLTIEGEQPITIKMVRVGTADEPDIAAQFKKAGLDPGTLGWIKDVLSKRGGIKDEQLEPAMAGILKTVLAMRKQGDGFQMDTELGGWLKDEVGLTDQQIGLVRGIAGRLQAAGRGGRGGRVERGKRPGTFTEGPTSVYVGTQVGNFDTNKSLTVEDGELEQGFLKMLGQAEESHGKLLTLFDGDKDGALNKEEGQAVRQFVFGLAGALLIDTSRDWKLDDKETDEAWATLADQSQRHNEAVSRRSGKR